MSQASSSARPPGQRAAAAWPRPRRSWRGRPSSPPTRIAGGRGRWPPPRRSWMPGPRTRRPSCSRPRTRARSTSSSRPGWPGCEPRSRSPARAAATPRRCCSTRRGASSTSTSSWRVRRCSTRSGRRSSPAASATGPAWPRSRTPPGRRPRDRSRRGRSTCSSTAWHVASPRATSPRSHRSGGPSRSCGNRTARPPTISAGCGWRAASRRSCGTTTRGMTCPPATSGSHARPVPSPSSPSPSPTAPEPGCTPGTSRARMP